MIAPTTFEAKVCVFQLRDTVREIATWHHARTIPENQAVPQAACWQRWSNSRRSVLRVRDLPGQLKGANIFFVEDVGYQKAAIQEMERMMLPVVAMKPQSDKRSRLQVVAQYIKNGTVLFPRSGCEQLLGQLFNLGGRSSR